MPSRCLPGGGHVAARIGTCMLISGSVRHCRHRAHCNLPRLRPAAATAPAIRSHRSRRGTAPHHDAALAAFALIDVLPVAPGVALPAACATSPLDGAAEAAEDRATGRDERPGRRTTRAPELQRPVAGPAAPHGGAQAAHQQGRVAPSGCSRCRSPIAPAQPSTGRQRRAWATPSLRERASPSCPRCNAARIRQAGAPPSARAADRPRARRSWPSSRTRAQRASA